MSVINVQYYGISGLFRITEREFQALVPSAKPIVKEFVEKLNQMGLSRRMNLLFFLVVLAFVIFLTSLFLILANIYFFSLAFAGILLVIIVSCSYQRFLKKIQKQIETLCSEYRIKLIEWYDISEIGIIQLKSGCAHTSPNIIRITSVVINLNEQNIEAENTEPIPFFTYHPKEQGYSQANINSQTELLTQPMTPFQEIESFQLNQADIKPEPIKSADSIAKTVITPKKPNLENIEINEEMIEVRTVPPTPQNMPHGLPVESVYSIPRSKAIIY
jgi:hypothetical protein